MAKVSVKKASKGLNKFNLNSDHKTTTDFGQMQVSQFLPVVPDDKISINMAVEARFAPMVVPTFMSVNLYTRAFFVPMDAIFHQFENYYIDKQDVSVLRDIPQFSNNSIVDYFVGSSKGLTVEITDYFTDGMAYDIAVSDKYYLFTEKGRIFLKLLHSLGYSINWSTSDTTHFNALPLIAFMRVVYDYIYPAQYVDALGLTKYFNISTAADLEAFENEFLSSSSSAFLNACVDLLTLPYKQDYFTAAWKNLNQPGSATQNISSPEGLSPVNSNPSFSVVQSTPRPSESISSSVGVSVSNSNSTINITQQSLNILSRLYDFVTRNNLVGTRFADQIFARFGIGSRKSNPNMSIDLGRLKTPISVQDVTQMASTGEGILGELGGKSYLSNNGHLLKFNSESFGYIIVLSYLMPDIGYYQGRKLWTIKKGNRFDDFYTPEFDLQMRAIRNDELFADYHNSVEYSQGQSYGGNPVGRFGFAPNYSEYKKGNDYLTGDFRIPSLARNLNSYHLMRDIPIPSLKNPLSLSSPFLFCDQHAFDKIYQQIYSVRFPLGKSVVSLVVPNSSTTFVQRDREVLSTNGRPIVLQNSGDYFVIFEDDGLLKILTIDQNQLAGSAFSNAYYVEVNLPTLTFPDFSLFGQNFQGFEQESFGTLPSSIRVYEWKLRHVTSSLTVPSDALDFDNFLLYFSDYIDHAYLHYYFHIEAYRPMATISEEFQIEDGGNLQSVDLLGNRD